MDISQYKQWIDDSSLRDHIAHGMDAYFIEKSRNLPSIDEGTPTSGYRFMLHIGDKYYSPFLAESIQEYYIAQLLADCGLPPSNSTIIYSTDVHPLTSDAPNVEATGKGYFYWPDRDLAEEYMKAFAIRHGENIYMSPNTFYSPQQAQRQQRTQLISDSLWDYFYDTREQWFDSQMNTFPDLRRLPIEQGEVGLYRVSGIAGPTPDTAGFTMNEMEIDKDVLLSFPINMPEEAVHGQTPLLDPDVWRQLKSQK